MEVSDHFLELSSLDFSNQWARAQGKKGKEIGIHQKRYNGYFGNPKETLKNCQVCEFFCEIKNNIEV